MRIDSHHHFWRYSAGEYGWINESMQTLRRDFLPSDLRPLIEHAGIQGVISVQARQTLTETQDLLHFAEQHPWIRGVVGWVPLCDPAVADHLEALASRVKLRAVRHVVQDEPDDRFLLRPDFMHGIAQLAKYGLVYDLLVFPKQLPAAIELVDHFPNQRFVLDHIAKPAITFGDLDAQWQSKFQLLSQRPNVYCKFSGVVTEVRDLDWTVETIRPYWNVAWECFGPQRLMFGTDWPVCLLRSRYAQWVATVEELAGSLSAAEKAAFWGGVACEAYSLPASLAESL